MKKAGEIFEKYNLIFLLPVIAVYLFTRLFYAGEIPYYLHIDELQEAYEALCVAHFGTDSTGAAPGIFFGGSGAGHSALLIYAGALMLKLKSGFFSLKLFRLIPVAAGLFGLIFSYLFVWQRTGKKKDGFIAAVLMAALPVFFVSQRNFVEDFLFPAILPGAFFFLSWGVRKTKKAAFLLSGLMFSVILFSCRMAIVIVPVFVILSVVYLFLIKKIRVADAVLLCAPVLISMAVLLLFSKAGTGINAAFANVTYNIKHLKRMFWDDRHDFNVISSFGTLYVFSVPVIIMGAVVSLGKLFSSLKKREFEEAGLIWIYAVSGTICCIFVEKADIGISCSLFFAAAVLIAEGISYIGDNLKGAFPVILLVYIIGLGILSHYYFVNYNSQLNHSKDHEKGIIVDKSVGEAVKTALKDYPDRGITVYTGDFEGRNLLIALYGSASPAQYAEFKDSSSFTFGNITVNPTDETEADESRIYIIDQYEHPELIEGFTSLGWGMMYLKEYTLFYR